MSQLFRYIPAIHSLQKREEFRTIQERYSLDSPLLTSWLQQIVEDLRTAIKTNSMTIDLKNEASTYEYVFSRLENIALNFVEKNRLQPVINATGVVIHTNLGRSRLSESALNQLVQAARSYSTLEYNIEKGVRGSRHDLVETYLTELTGAEAALVVNNNAAAVYFVLNAFAKGKEVIVSRGELVEIGGSFRINEIMNLSEAKIKEVGTTNRTKLSDYEKALSEETGMLLKVHKSNFALVGFTEEVPAAQLANLAKQHKVLLYEDLGSGTLFNFSKEGTGSEPTVQEQVEKGIDLISFSGDKLLGGPQAGIIVGKKRYIDKLKAHQLARVLRVDKFTLASLEATLKSYLKNQAPLEVPTVRDILKSKEEVLQQAKKFVEQISNREAFHCSISEGVSKVGGGTMPDVDIPTYIVEVSHRALSSEEVATQLRLQKTPIIVRVKDEKVVLDFRTVTEEELRLVIEGFMKLTEKKR
ncbi:MAG TPA: L-seryl-tRNA(Sec) selenium transferase [Pseudogracilibacillus sp.]|nr:L-seryl-tRNA(Sec) selenium transferase [Pseudogracilibacillus sp.]